MRVRNLVCLGAIALMGCVATAMTLQAAPYASGVVKTGSTVNFILNEPADALTYSINGGAAVALDGTTKGAKMFTLGAATDTFSIVATKNAATGWSIPTGGTIAGGTTQAPVDTAEAGLNIISDDLSLLTRFNSPRGVGVSNDPNAPNFGTAYITNSAAATIPDPVNRTVGDGLYALRADGSDAYGNGDNAANPMVDGFPAWVASTSSPFRAFVADDGFVYVADWSDDNGSLIRISPDISPANIIGTNVLTGFGGPAAGLPAGQFHGSISGAYVTGSTAGGNFTVYTVDEDLTTAHVTGSGSTTDKNSVWRYDVGAGPLPSAVAPTNIAKVLLTGAEADVTLGAGGKIYASQYRFDGNQAGLFVLDAAGATLFNSLEASRTLLNNPTSQDIMRLLRGITISEDQQWLAGMLAYSDVVVMPLVDGIPDLANRMVVNTGDDVTFGRDIEFDAANNIHYVSSGQARYRVLASGGETTTTLRFDGTDYDFTISTVAGPGDDDADFDGDGDVDGQDFLTWQRGLGAAGDLADGDADGDMFVDGDDLAIWRTQFGPGAPATSTVGAVPEPSTWALAALVCAACIAAAAPYRRAALARVKVAG